MFPSPHHPTRPPRLLRRPSSGRELTTCNLAPAPHSAGHFYKIFSMKTPKKYVHPGTHQLSQPTLVSSLLKNRGFRCFVTVMTCDTCQQHTCEMMRHIHHPRRGVHGVCVALPAMMMIDHSLHVATSSTCASGLPRDLNLSHSHHQDSLVMI